MEKTKLELAIVLPELDADDECAKLITEQLSHKRGIEMAHIVKDNGAAKLCLHFDQNLVSLDTVERLARQAGAEVTDRYRHERIPFKNLNAADAAISLERHLEALKGVIHASVNYAAGIISVAYDSTIVQRDAVRQAIQEMGAQIVTEATSETNRRPGHQDHRETKSEEHSEDHEHDHGSAPTFLPHWMQERWTLILVLLAGVFFLSGWIGERFLGFTPELANVFFILAYIAGGYDVATHAIPALFKGKLDTDILMLAAAAGAAALGELSEGAFLLLLFSIGHAGEHYALDRARNAINALGALMPKTAQVKRGDKVVEEPVEQLAVGDIVVVRPGDRIPVDGTVASGSSIVDQSPITGESVPVTKAHGDETFAGTVNKDNALEIKVSRVAADNTLKRVMTLVAEAQSQQSPTQQFADRFTSRFVPAVFVATALLIVVPPFLNLLTLQESFYRGMLLLVAASPCALAIGTPASVLAGIAQAARNGVLIKGGVHLENLGRLKAIAFDKTGTITSGVFTVTDVIPMNGATPDELLGVAGRCRSSVHPSARALGRARGTRETCINAAGGRSRERARTRRSQRRRWRTSPHRFCQTVRGNTGHND